MAPARTGLEACVVVEGLTVVVVVVVVGATVVVVVVVVVVYENRVRFDLSEREKNGRNTQ